MAGLPGAPGVQAVSAKSGALIRRAERVIGEAQDISDDTRAVVELAQDQGDRSCDARLVA
jgi:hypothetical protein